jgi:hypothetical protein
MRLPPGTGRGSFPASFSALLLPLAISLTCSFRSTRLGAANTQICYFCCFFCSKLPLAPHPRHVSLRHVQRLLAVLLLSKPNSFTRQPFLSRSHTILLIKHQKEQCKFSLNLQLLLDTLLWQQKWLEPRAVKTATFPVILLLY